MLLNVIAKRFQRQIFLSLDLGPILQSGPYSAMGEGEAARVMLYVEKELLVYLSSVLEAKRNGI